MSYFHRSTMTTEKLLSIQSQANKNTKAIKLKQDVETRWNSTFYMMEWLLKLREAVTTALYLSGKNHLCLTNSEADSIQHIVSVLSSFERAIREMSSESFISLSKIIAVVHLLQGSLGSTYNSSQ